jgi:hypothetical protein
MSGSFDFTPYDNAVAMDALPIGVFLFQPKPPKYTLLPNVRCEQVQYKEGAEPPTARFSYILDLLAGASGWPDQFEEIWPLTAVKPGYVVGLGDELVVIALMPDQSTRILFHGLARVPQTDISPETQHVNFVAVGVAIRCWDTPIGGRIQRQTNKPQSTADDDQIQTDLPTRFNPAGTGVRAVGGILPDCTPDNYDVNQGRKAPYPVFLDPALDVDPSPLVQWDLSRAVRYILGTQNTLYNLAGELIVDNPDFGALDSLLQNRRPLDGQDFYDPDDPSTYQTDKNVVRDFDATNKAWPDAIAQLLGFYGFAMRFVCEDDGEGFPYDYMEFYRKDQAGPTDPKSIYLPPSGSNLTDSIVNVGHLHAAFDFHNVANDFFVESHLERHEISVVLAPGFQPTAEDGAAGTVDKFLLTNVNSPNATAAIRKAYRYYIADECGDGHFSIANQTWQAPPATPMDFSALWPNPDEGPEPGYVNRYRPGKGTLFSKDPLDRRYKAQLAVSRDYDGADPPCMWDSVSGTWQQIAPGTWDLLPDRLGINVTCPNPEAWEIGKAPAGNAPNGQPWPQGDGKLRGVSSMANPGADKNSGQFWLRLTTVVEADFGIGTEALRRDASPLPTTVQRRIDATDHFHYDVVDGSSAYSTNPGLPGPENATVVEDDTDDAEAHACQLRSAHEFPPLTATVTVPQLVTYLQIGDRVGKINGRDVSLLVNAGREQGEEASYPFVVAMTWDFQGEKQSTTLHLTDRRAEPRRPIS